MRVLHHYWLSTGSRFCRLLLKERKLEVLLKLEQYWERTPSFLTVNIAGDVPVLVEDDGTTLCCVWSIIEYFEDLDRFSGHETESMLLPGDAAARAEARRMADWFATKLERDVVMPLIREKVLRRILRDGEPSSNVIRTALSNLRIHLEYINHLAENRAWLAGQHMTIADLYGAASLSVLDYMGDVPWQEWQEAKTWYSRVKSRPAFRDILSDNVVGVTPPPHYTNLDF